MPPCLQEHAQAPTPVQPAAGEEGGVSSYEPSDDEDDGSECEEQDWEADADAQAALVEVRMLAGQGKGRV